MCEERGEWSGLRCEEWTIMRFLASRAAAELEDVDGCFLSVYTSKFIECVAFPSLDTFE